MAAAVSAAASDRTASAACAALANGVGWLDIVTQDEFDLATGSAGSFDSLTDGELNSPQVGQIVRWDGINLANWDQVTYVDTGDDIDAMLTAAGENTLFIFPPGFCC